jgi:predicted nucleic acid-binding protein
VIRRDISEERAIAAVSALGRATIVAVDASLALEAADVSLERDLAMADSIDYATARRYGARLVTADTDFEGPSRRDRASLRSAQTRLDQAGVAAQDARRCHRLRGDVL